MKWIIDWQIVHGKVQQSLLVLLSCWSLFLGTSYSARAEGIVGFDATDFEPSAALQQPRAQLTPPYPSNGTPLRPTPQPTPVVRQSSPHPSIPSDSEVVSFPTESSLPIARADRSTVQSLPRADRTTAQPVESTTASDDNAIFAGGENSLVARAVGSAEGTRRPDGGKNPAYYGHVDPGNAQWNLGSFSYQHGAASPENADDRQLRRLQRQDQIIRERAVQYGMKLGLQERLNAIDLANQAPLAALDRGGYVEQLKAAKQDGLSGEAAILEARVNSYRHPDTQQWDAPGLGNNESFIRHDQARRMDAIAQAIVVDQTWTRQKGQFRRIPRSTGTEIAQVMQMDQTWTR
ncbi:hypothetical protein ACN4EG_00850 [Alkalinema pantanalense CENA528]|uniref:hypothetical protein n=1 Tax=Alkalinema pantanalense TaxID=1620705 RepID=UPI003D700E86